MAANPMIDPTFIELDDTYPPEVWLRVTRREQDRRAQEGPKPTVDQLNAIVKAAYENRETGPTRTITVVKGSPLDKALQSEAFEALIHKMSGEAETEWWLESTSEPQPNPPLAILKECSCWLSLKTDEERENFRFWKQPCACSANPILNKLDDDAE